MIVVQREFSLNKNLGIIMLIKRITIINDKNYNISYEIQDDRKKTYTHKTDNLEEANKLYEELCKKEKKLEKGEE